jgi:signal transduction histidine kinase
VLVALCAALGGTGCRDVEGHDRVVVALDAATLTTPSRTVDVTLPHALPAADFVPAGSVVTYRLHVPRPAATNDEPLALYLPRMSSSGRVLLNGEEVGRCADGPLSRIRCVQHPTMITPPPAAWQSGDNVIDVDVFANAMQVNGLSRVFVGPRDAVAALYLQRIRTQVAPMTVFAIVMITLGVVALLVSRLLRQGPVYGWFALSCILVGVDHIDNLIVHPGVDLATFEWFATSVRVSFSGPFLLTCFAYFDRLGPRTRALWLGLGVVTPACLWLARGNPSAIQFVVLFVVVPSLVSVALLFRWTWQSRDPRHVALLLALLPPLIASVHDMDMFFGGNGVEAVWLVNYGSTVTLLFVAALMVRDIARAVQTARDLTTHLEERVAAQQVEIERAYDERLRSEQQQARAREREELLRDMHDGFGSTLATARILLSDGGSAVDTVRVLDECRDDLRLVVDTLGNDEGRLDWALGDFRQRLTERLNHSSVAVLFDVDLSGAPALPQRTQLQLLRIVQEAVTNALRHAGAGTIAVRARWKPADGAVVLSVEDDGHGFTLPGPSSASSPPSTGRGLLNMARRARSIGATLAITPRAPGTQVEVRWMKTTTTAATATATPPTT